MYAYTYMYRENTVLFWPCYSLSTFYSSFFLTWPDLIAAADATEHTGSRPTENTVLPNYCFSPEGSCSTVPRVQGRSRWGRPGSRLGLWVASHLDHTGCPPQCRPRRPPLPSSHTYSGGAADAAI